MRIVAAVRTRYVRARVSATAIDTHIPRTLRLSAMCIAFKVRDLGRVCRGVEISAPIHQKTIATRFSHRLQHIDTAIHESHHRIIRAGPPIAVRFGGLVARECQRRALVHQKHVADIVTDGEFVCGRNAGDPCSTNHHVSVHESSLSIAQLTRWRRCLREWCATCPD